MDMYVNVLANIIIQQYFGHSRCVLVFSDNSTQFQYYGNLPLVNLKSESGVINSEVLFRYHGCQGIVIKSKKYLTIFENLEHEMRMNNERFNQRKYLFLPSDDTHTVDDTVNIFQSAASKYVPDLVMVQLDYENTQFGIFPDTDVVFSLWSHQYVGYNNNDRKVLLDTWFSKNMSFGRDTSLYKDKLSNQMGRDIKIATFQYEPYSIIGSSVNDYKGSELSTALMFAKQYNMTPTLVVNPEDYWGEIFDNWTGNGLLGNLVIEKADIGLCALYTWEFAYHFLDLSKPLVRTGVTCLVPAPKLAAGWLTPLYSYSPAMWYGVASMFFLSVISHFLIQFLNFTMVIRDNCTGKNTIHQLCRSTFGIFKLFALQVLTKVDQPKGFIGKYFMGLLFAFSLILSSSYSSGLSSIMTIPRYENAINTVQEFATSGIHWGGTQDAWIISIEKVEDPIYQEIVRRFVATSEGNLRDYSKKSSFAFSLERLPNDNYAIGTYVQEDVIDNFHLMQDDFYWEQCVMMARKNSVLLPMLDMFILRVFETGLISYWQNEATALYMNAKVQKAVKYYSYNKDKPLVKLKWIHVEGAFAILCIGLGFSIFVFTFEIVIHDIVGKSAPTRSHWIAVQQNLIFSAHEYCN